MQGPKLLIRAVVVFSLALVAALYACFWVFGSQLALAQAADSFMDVFTAIVLGWTVAVAARPSDEDHPFGHFRAEPIGALVAAIVAGVLAIEVGRSAIMALVADETIRLDWLLVVVFGSKTVVKGTVVLVARAMGKRHNSPALQALRVDARNDVLVSLVAIAGYFGARFGMERLDAILALPVAVWIGLAGLRLARDNIKLLMGEAPPQQRQDELRALARGVEGVIDAHDLRAHFVGTHLHLQVHVLVNPDLSVRKAHDIGEAVRARLESEADVAQCFVHIDGE
ncbi:MAG: cation transporter [Planctomycetes bacterium]|nr:cation transporter [Planctomycetota bacterium]